MEVVNVYVKAAEEGEKHAKEAVSGENVAESQHDKQRPPSPEYDQFQAWLQADDDTVGGQQPFNEDTAQQERDFLDIRPLFKPGGSAVRAELKRKKDELEVLTTERKKKKERRQTLEASLAGVSQKLEMSTPTKETGVPELPPVLMPIPEVPEAESRHATPVSEHHKYVLTRQHKYDVLSTSFTGNILTCPSNEEKKALLRNLLDGVKESIRVQRAEEVAPGDDDEEVQEEFAKVEDLLDDEFTPTPTDLPVHPDGHLMEEEKIQSGALTFRE
ncbi:hypothetical protein CYMTET_26108 [Cymbomonas tetramitiformis]|uniref:Uncharacterized protein n=1 Tax=Cymbomonas tetramitiformis TaxID=36881 RepID=A0AAE0FSX9_9CHLO|nr:hypothetical protein CYMTET_26108 [Cymbomonas tetramitiformis]